MEEFGFWLSDMEDKIAHTVSKPTTRIEACQLLAKTKARKEAFYRMDPIAAMM